MRAGLIDLGTNSIRYDIIEYQDKKRIKILVRYKEMIRLGSNLFNTGFIEEDSLARLLQSLNKFKQQTTKLEVNFIEAFATCALREAQNKNVIRQLIKEKTAIDFQIISGDEEAQLIAIGILNNDPRCKGDFALIDIGGGSAEVSICQDIRRLQSISTPLGVSRVQQKYLPTIPPSSLLPLQKFLQEIQPMFQSVKKANVSKAIGSSGTIKALGHIHEALFNSPSITDKGLKKIIERILPLSFEEITMIPGMNPNRVEMILAGALILEFCMNQLQISTVIPTEFALRDGILLRLVTTIPYSRPS